MAEETKIHSADEETETSTSRAQPAADAPEAEEGKKKKAKHKNAAADLAAAQVKADEAEAKQMELQNALLRTAAEYENYRKRSQKERDAAFNDGVTHAALEMLPVIDTLEAAANAQTTDEEYKKGVMLTLSQCTEIFKKLGIEEIECLGLPFDPELHDAVMQAPVEGVEPGNVSHVIRKGYKLGDKVVRHAMVGVAP